LSVVGDRLPSCPVAELPVAGCRLPVAGCREGFKCKIQNAKCKIGCASNFEFCILNLVLPDYPTSSGNWQPTTDNQ
jgi:hypothetical protein